LFSFALSHSPKLFRSLYFALIAMMVPVEAQMLHNTGSVNPAFAEAERELLGQQEKEKNSQLRRQCR
jgi:hypothetical protein